MTRLVLHRLWQTVPVLLAVILLTFAIIRAAPGGPFDEERAASPEVIAKIEAYYHLDAPWWRQLLAYVGNLLRGDLGPSLKYEGRTVNELIAQAFPVSLELGVYALLVALLLGLPAGTLAAVRRDGFWDRLLTGVSLLGICLPTFVMGPALILVFSIGLGWVNPTGWETPGDRLLPSLTLGLLYAAYVARLTRAGVLDVMAEPFIRTARAKGLSPWQIVTRHALRGGLLPTVSFLGPATAGLVTGSFVVETIFFVPGLGRFFVNSAFNRDYSMILGTVLFYAVLIIALNLVVDIVLAALDPRQRDRA